MVSIEELGLVISIITGTVAPVIFMFLIRHVRKGDNTKDNAALAIFNIDTIKDDLHELKQHLQELRKKQYDDNIKIWEKVDRIHSDVKLHDYRLNKLDHNGSNVGAVIL